MCQFQIVASAENNPYMQWQAMLFHYSCVTYHGTVPIIVVHQGNEPTLPGFQMIQAKGGNIQTAANLRHHGGVEYPPRNTVVALQSVDSDADYLVLCDCDMIFFKPLPLDELPLTRNTITFDRVNYLDPDLPHFQPDIDDVFGAEGIDPATLRSPVIDGGVPHVIAREQQLRLSQQWLRCIDLFPIRFTEGQRPNSTDLRYANWPYRCYLASMWALVMAKHHLQLDHWETRFAISNYDDQQPLPGGGQSGLLHYAYGSERFDKRNVDVDKRIHECGFWNIAPGDDTIAGTIRRQFAEAGQYYGLAERGLG